MSVLGSAGRSAGKVSPWVRAIAIAEITLVVKQHLDRLGPGEGAELRGLLVKSKGRPGNLTEVERARVYELVRKLEPAAFARSAAARAMPLRRRP